MNNDDVMVSISCLTYNQEKYIRQCLEGFVMQKTNFRFEAIVHDDASTDKTPEIIREFEKKYPDVIKPIYEVENQYSKACGILEDIMVSHLKGRYVAICEGDDYWTDPYKLQKQFDFMESHPDCSMCFHPYKNLYPDGHIESHVPKINKVYYSVSDIIWRGAEFIATNSIFFRKEFYLKYSDRPDFWKYSPVGDYPLVLYLSLKGKVCFLNNLFSTYRINAAGSWTNRNSDNLSKKIALFHSSQLLYKRFNRYTKYKYSGILLFKRCRVLVRLIKGIFASLI